ncbi:hypothetical protein MD484_g8131, partial [Candolleomyces efflorescens]
MNRSPQPLPAVSYDVWANIASFLPSKALQGLYSVNQALFNLSMDERYRRLDLSNPGDESTRTFLQRLRSDDQFRIRRVRELILSIRAFGFFPGLDNFDWRASLSKNGLDAVYYNLSQKQKKKSKKKAGKLAEAESSLVLLQETLNVIRAIPELQRCVIQGAFPAPGHGSSYGIAFPLVLAAWSASKSTMRALELEVPVEVLSEILPPQLAFDGLEHFGINLNITYRSTDAMEMLLSTMVPFISRHQSTIRSFALRTSEHLHLTPFFKSLPSIPLLRDLEIEQGYVSTLQTDTIGLHDFLIRHAEQLKNLTLLFDGLGLHLVRDKLMEDWPQHPCLHVSYPNLHRLSFGLHNFPQDFGEKIQQSLDDFWTPKLRHFKLAVNLEADQVDIVLSKIPKDVELASLSLAVETLEPELFDTLSTRLPHLVDLEVEVTSGKLVGLETAAHEPPTDDHDSDSESGSEERVTTTAEDEGRRRQFVTNMEQRNYANWPLRHLTVSLSSLPVTEDPLDMVITKRAIASALPNLQILQFRYKSILLKDHVYDFQF